MDLRIEQSLERAIAASEGPGTPPGLGAAIRHAVFPGGARVRPQLCLAVAEACADGVQDLKLAMAAAVGIEFLHCASLVHDDLPCFDDAPLRRGQPSVHGKFGESLAVLTGDALIISAYDTVIREAEACPDKRLKVLRILTRGAGAADGLVSGQAWECESQVNVRAYHRSKTGALFVAAAGAGAVSVGADPTPWRALGDRLGEAYQIADDIRDCVLDAYALGKPAQQDARHGRPNAVQSFGLENAVEHLNALVRDASEAIPDCDGAESLRTLIHAQAARLAPPVQEKPNIRASRI